MDRLPLELIEKILSNSALSVKDVVNFSSTCHRFRDSVLTSSIIWRHKFHDKYPQYLDLFENTQVDFYEEIQYIYKLKKRSMALLKAMSERYHSEKIDLKEWGDLLNEKKETYHYLVSVLTEIIDASFFSGFSIPHMPGPLPCELYAKRVLIFVKQQYLAERLPPKNKPRIPLMPVN